MGFKMCLKPHPLSLSSSWQHGATMVMEVVVMEVVAVQASGGSGGGRMCRGGCCCHCTCSLHVKNH